MTVEELAAGETGRAFEAMRALRPHLAGDADFARRVDELQRPQGYRLVAVVEADGAVTAVAGPGRPPAVLQLRPAHQLTPLPARAGVGVGGKRPPSRA